MEQIETLEQLMQLYRQPSNRAGNKTIYRIDEYVQRLIEHSPFIVISTVDEDGFTDVSPRGGVPGFVKVVDSNTLLIPDSSGNNRLDSFKNILERPQVGMMIMVPGIDEVVRIKGTASLHTDEQRLALCPDGNKPAKLVIQVKAESMFFHCAKAIMRAKLWDGEYRVERSILPSLGQILKQQQNLEEAAMSQEDMVAYYNKTL
ncbi:pyridoxamine 5'-phosphate oxidase family protein [Photobacterium atrarenae]|uniref:Pyridoxamine 5'-phosphate oxidase family protein n=1 Tax=Photobacterium atrarenae TaxID=865757 RepID=A0ABY5GBA9_9GAMM|nr:pyridoxamine 5'-phosphate oxidase family protein [Photobacterium atrarenae]UTV26446.1 pyridoxamine 5'-phosphate oxidase family protein [Photobacterium atrarenae]